MNGWLALPGLGGGSPASALMLYGICRTLDGSQVRWTRAPSGWIAEIQAPGAATIDDLASRLRDRVASDPLASLPEVAKAKDINEVIVDDWPAAAEAVPSAARDVVVGLSSLSPVRAGGRVSLTPLCVYSFGTRGRLFDNAATQDEHTTAAEYSSLLKGGSHPHPKVNTLGLDPSARRQEGAIMGPDPSGDGVRGVPGIVPLALRGLAAVAPMPARSRFVRGKAEGGHPAGGAFAWEGGSVEFTWPMFTAPVSSPALAIVAGRDWRQRNPAERAAAGVEAVFACRVLRSEKRLSLGRQIA